MANTTAISQIGGALAGGGANTTGIGAGQGAAPGNVSGISVSGTVDPIALEISLVVTFTPPSDAGDTWTGVHLYLDIPDHGDGSTTAVTGTAVTGTSQTTGPFNPIDLGLQTNPTQPWYITCPFPTSLGLNPKQNIACRLYLASISVISANQLIQDGQPNATPNQAFTLVSLASGTSSAGTNVTVNCGAITCQALAVDTSTGKSMSPFLALMASVPANPPKGWGYRLYLYTGVSKPTAVANMTPLTDVCTTAGVVPQGKADLVTDVLNSFAIQTPGTPTTATVYAVAGIVGANGTFTANNVVPGITNSCMISLGTSSGTINAAQAIQSSIAARLSVIDSQLDITPSSLNASTYLVAGTIVGSLLAASNIITSSAQIGSAVVGAANIGSCNVSSLLAGTATFAGPVIFQNSSGPEVAITSAGVALVGGAYTVGVSSSSGITISSSSASLAITTSISLTAGSNSLALSSSSVTLTAGSNSLVMSSSAVTLTNTANSTTTVLQNTTTAGGLYSGLDISAASFHSYFTAQGVVAYYGGTLYAQLGAVTSQGGLSLFSSGGDSIQLNFAGGSSPQLDINNNQVVGPRQTGPGSPSFSTLSGALSWCQALYNALSYAGGGHGLIN